MISQEEIKQLIRKGEDSHLEYKEKIDSFDSLGAEITAFANSKGGVILIGISDNQKIIGLDNATIEKYQQQISNIANNHIKPKINLTSSNIEIENKIIIHIKIENTNPPYQDSKGVYWIRGASSKHKASNEELVRLFAKGKHIHIDEEDTKAKISDTINMIDFNLFLDKNYPSTSEEERKNTTRLLTNLNLANNDGYFNLAGLLIFAKNPQFFKPLLNIECCHFDSNDSSSTSFIDRESINGNIQSLYLQAMGFIKRNLKRKQIGDEFNQKGKLEINEIAISEAIINALVHRDLYISDSIKIFLFKDTLKIISVGSLSNHLNIDKIKQGVSIKRNQTIHQVVSKILPYSGLGTGIKRIMELAKVEFENNEDLEQFVVSFVRDES